MVWWLLKHWYLTTFFPSMSCHWHGLLALEICRAFFDSLTTVTLMSLWSPGLLGVGSLAKASGIASVPTSNPSSRAVISDKLSSISDVHSSCFFPPATLSSSGCSYFCERRYD